MRTSRWTIIRSLVLTTMFAGIAWGQSINNPQFGAQNQVATPYQGSVPYQANTPYQAGIPNQVAAVNPVGALNYVEGQASINGQTLTPRSVGSADLQRGQSLVTQSGKAEILLTPGVFLRVDDNSSVLMVSPSLAPTVVELVKGRAMVEVAYIRKENDIHVEEDDASIKLLKKGLYDFDADSGQVRVFKGEAAVYVGNRKINVGQSEEVTLNSGIKPKEKDFKPAQYEGDFYDWCRLRSENVLEANAALAAQYGSNWYGPGWYWDPWFDAWAFPYDWGWAIIPLSLGMVSAMDTADSDTDTAVASEGVDLAGAASAVAASAVAAFTAAFTAVAGGTVADTCPSVGYCGSVV